MIFSLMMGEQGLTYLFLREKFGWTLEKYTMYNSALSAVGIFGVFLSIYILHKLLSVTESVLILMGLINGLNGSLLQGLATKDVHIYIGKLQCYIIWSKHWQKLKYSYIFSAGVVRCLGGIASPMMKTLMSKLIPAHETAKLFSLVMIFNFAFGLGATPMYNTLYKHTLNTNPSIYNFLTAGFHVMGIFIFM